ncbi:unnamed protein product [Rotaria socialis]|uniref:F-box domain-containing protein n=1 Tax=Rotaria socialis TaxID=392032 RepID=A0A820PHF5_9BILA|nr:unnamed protein product [Rotaria socialis]CAF4403395.1 unnamed protein product [Rotaria socialis]
MERIKRQLDDIVDVNNNNKKQKIFATTNQFNFENLANEIIYDIFEYLDVYDIYYGFYHLNKRFKNLTIYSNLHCQVDISTMSKSNFESYYEDIIKPNKNRIKILRLSNPFTIDLIFSPPRVIYILITFLKHLIYLPKLHSLTVSTIDNIPNPSSIFIQIFQLTKFKYCKIKHNEDGSPINFDECKQSSIEHLIIDSPFRYELFNKLLTCLPKLRHLSINYLTGSNYSEIDFYPILLKDLKSVSFGIYSVHFEEFKKLTENFFNSIESLRISTHNNSSYSHAKQWEELISSSMPNLRSFDLQNHYAGAMQKFLYSCLGGKFGSKFWTEKQWFFKNQDGDHKSSDNGLFFSINPYRKYHTFHWHSDHYNAFRSRRIIFKSVKHLYICGKQAINNSVSYFPNVTELTIKDYARIYCGSMLAALNEMIPLKQLNKLTIDCNDFPINKLVNLLSLTPNLRTLKWNFQSVDHPQLKLIQQSETFRFVSRTNKIQNLEIAHSCTLYEIYFLVDLFPQLECLKTGINRKEFVIIARHFVSKMPHLFYLCITDLSKTYSQKLNILIKAENLLDDYFIKFVDRDFYLWW